MNQKKAVFIGLVALAILVFFMIADYKNKGGLGGGVVSQNILYITQPVMSFSGIVEKIEGNKITVSQKQMLMQTGTAAQMPPVAITGVPSPYPTPKMVTITYQTTLSDRTQISQPAPYISYLFKTGAPGAQEKLTIKDIKVGQNITVNSQSDLRTLSGNVFEAVMINLPQKTNTLNGRISGVEGNSLTIKAFPPLAMGAYTRSSAMGTAQNIPKEKEYTITITKDTEISRMIYSTAMMTPGEPPTPPKTEKLAPSDLKKDMQATVYTDADVTQGSSFIALRIEPMIVAITPTTPLMNTPPPAISTTPASGAAQMIAPTP